MDKRGQEVKYICKEDLRKLRKYFKLNDKVVILALINIGVNVGLRISDLSKIRFEDINSDYVVNNTFWVGVYPGMTDTMIDYMAKIIKEAVSR